MAAQRADGMTVLVFDLMDTVVVDPFFAQVLPRFATSLSALRAARDPECWPAFERGEIDEATFLARFYRERDDALPSPDVLRDTILGGFDYVPGMRALLERIDRQNATSGPWLLSNYPCWFETVRQQLGLDRFFAGYVVSYQSGARKPEPEAFEAAERAIGVAAETLLLVDDRAENCVAARARGWQACIFRGVEQLEAELRGRGLLI